MPEASLNGYVDHTLGKEFRGVVPSDQHDDWFMGINLSYPIFEGGARGFNYDKQKAALKRLKFTKHLTQDEIELEVRKAAYLMFFSLPNIEFRHEAMFNASENYGIMSNKYSKGTASITDLISAQNEKFTRQGQAVISIYQFLQDLATFDRAIARYRFFSSDEERKEWIKELKEYFAARGITVELAA